MAVKERRVEEGELLGLCCRLRAEANGTGNTVRASSQRLTRSNRKWKQWILLGWWNSRRLFLSLSLLFLLVLQFHLCNKLIEFPFQNTADSQDPHRNHKPPFHLISRLGFQRQHFTFFSRKSKNRKQQQRKNPKTKQQQQKPRQKQKKTCHLEATTQIHDRPLRWPDSGYEPQNVPGRGYTGGWKAPVWGNHLSSPLPGPPKRGVTKGGRGQER